MNKPLLWWSFKAACKGFFGGLTLIAFMSTFIYGSIWIIDHHLIPWWSITCIFLVFLVGMLTLLTYAMSGGFQKKP